MIKINSLKFFRIILLFGYLFSSCDSSYVELNMTQESKNNLNVETIQIPEDFNRHLLHDSLILDYNIIELETNDDCLINEITQIIYYKQKFYISDFKGGTLFVFDRNGKFIFKINSVGRGPNEYPQLLDFKVDTLGKIYLLAYKKILVFSEYGIFLEERKFDFLEEKNLWLYPKQFALGDEGQFFFWRGTFKVDSNEGNDLFAMYKTNERFSIIDHYFPLERKIIGTANRFYGKYDNYLMQTFLGNDTIYRITSGNVIPYYFVDFGDRQVPFSLLPKSFEGMGDFFFKLQQETNYCCSIDYPIETKNHLYFTFLSGGKYRHAIYDKRTKNVIVGSVLKDYFLISSAIRCSDTNSFISIIEPSYLGMSKLYLDHDIPHIENQIREILASKKEYDNPVLFKFTLDGLN